MPARAKIRRPFTLIEILAVIAIMFVLAGLVIGVAAAVSRNSAEAKTKAALEKMMLALQEHSLDRGYHPGEAVMAGSSSGFVSFNIANLDDFRHTQTGRPYLEGYAGGAYLDGWKNPFQYRLDADMGYRLRSLGDDELPDTEDDICSWKQR
ncbi:MAG: type II secretion system protein GspG [Lentisphaeria bacterium]|nr:type II secretion system protein GspG [Lentisphaeria bacterium]